MEQLDEIDLEILHLLAEDARRPFSEIAERVDLSPPAVSDRVSRLEEFGVIRNFTLDIDRSKILNRIPVLVSVSVEPSAVEAVFEEIAAFDETEHVFQLFDGTIFAHLNAPDHNVHAWFRERFPLEELEEYDIRPIADYHWSAAISPADFAISCAVCENTVRDDGVIARIDNEIKAFCCESCEKRYRDQYEALKQDI